MGANDYSLEWYSYDETPEDYSLQHFSIARDQQCLIPYIHEAQKLNPQLRFWASPWCPPAWMKTNGHYAGVPSPVNDLKPAQAGREMHTQFRMEPRVLAAYALYFARFLDAYRAEGINIDAVHVQNEPNSCQSFPSCVWTPGDLALFIGGYLGPQFAKDKRTTQIWLGTIERPQVERVDAILADPGTRPFISGVGFQWAGKEAISHVRRGHPDLQLMQTETECGDGADDWAAAEYTFSLMKHYFDNGAGAYMFWNMVLDETGTSRWGWRQNAMATVNRQTQAVIYNPEFILMKHFSHFVRPGAKKLCLGGAGANAVAFVNPDGEKVLIFANLGNSPQTLQIKIGGQSLAAEIPARSFSTLRF
jgi:glucosylceramidase